MHVVALNLQRDWRGGEHQVFLLARELRGHEVQQTLICRRNSPLEARARSLEGVAVLGVANQFEAFVRLPRRARKERGETRNPIIYHAHTGNTVPLAVIAVGWRRRSVITRHLDRPVTGWICRKADRAMMGSAEGCR